MWETLIKDWKNATGRFTSHPRYWDGRPTFDRDSDPTFGPEYEDIDDSTFLPIRPASTPHRLAYTDDEELAMGQFIQHQADTGQELKHKSWQIFAEVVSFTSVIHAPV